VPHPLPVPEERQLSRRALVGTAAAVAASFLVAGVSGCSTPDPNDPNAPTPTGDDDPDFALRSAVVLAEATLIAAYDATLAAFPSLAEQLQPFRDNHAAHLEAVNVGGAIEVPAPRATQIPTSPTKALRRLAAAEGAAAAERAANCLTSARWQLARELSLIGACEAAHSSLIVDGLA